MIQGPSLARYVKGFARVDAADALTDLKEPRGVSIPSFTAYMPSSPAKPQVYNKTP